MARSGKVAGEMSYELRAVSYEIGLVKEKIKDGLR
jgi:hypothetical protein